MAKWTPPKDKNLTQDVGILLRRAQIVKAIRAFFDSRGFVEVETAVRIAAPAPEEHIDCPVVAAPGGGESYLRASPELQMKKLLAAGMERIYQIGPCFREGEKGSRHNPEFTMLEWYRKSADYLDIMRDTQELVSALTKGARLPCRDISVREAYRRYASWDPWARWDADRFDFDMATKIEPALKEVGGLVFLRDYPAAAASLSRLSSADESDPERFAERWELYWDGMEIANCFTELCDGQEQRLRFERSKEARKKLEESDYPIDFEFFDCLHEIKSAAGVALGIDRLVMVLTGCKEISAVRAKI
jgi:lysyl-tRNA synthetase class 2